MGRLLTTFKDKTFEPSMKSYFKLYTDDTSTASQIYDSLLYVRGTNAGSLVKNQENDDDVSTVETYDTYMPVRFHNIKSASDGNTPAGSTHTFYSVYNRAEYNGPSGQNMYDLYADYNIAKLSGDGYITNSIGGAYNYGYDAGSGDGQTIPGVYGVINYARVQPTGSNRTVTYNIGARNWVDINKSDLTATYVYPTISEFAHRTGTVGTLAMHKFDLDYTEGNITNAYFIWADESTLPTPSGEKYFIKSNIPWPTLLSSSLTNTGAVTFQSTLSVSGTATLSSNVNIGGNLVVTGTSTFNGGTITIGDAASDNVVFGADVDSHIIPDDDNTYDLGSSTQEWRNLYIDGTAYIDVLSLSNNLDLADNIAVRWGDSQDLRIVHDGTDSFINSNGSGDLYVQQFNDDKDIIFKSDDGSGGVAEYFKLDGQYTLNKFSKNVRFIDSVNANFGDADDLRIYHNGTNSNIENFVGSLQIIQNLDDGDISFKSDDGSGGTAEYFRVDGGSTNVVFSKDLLVNTTGGYFEVDVSDNSIKHADNTKAKYGTGNDLQIYHNGSNSYIQDSGTGELRVLASTLSVRNSGDTELMITAVEDGAVNLYHNNSKKFETTSTGVTVTGDINLGDSSYLYIGASNDLQLIHDGTDSYIQNTQNSGDLVIQNGGNDKDVIFKCDDGSGGLATYFFLDGSNSHTNFQLNARWVDSAKAQFGNSGDFNIFHNGTNSYLENDTGDLYIRNNSDDKDIYFQTDDGSGGTTTYFMCDGSLASSGFTTTLWGDQMQIALGDDRDLRLWHQSSNNYIAAYTGDLYIKNETDDGNIIFENDNGSGGLSNYIVLDGGDVSTKIETIKVLMPNLPTSDPSVAGQLWNSSGDLKISAG